LAGNEQIKQAERSFLAPSPSGVRDQVGHSPLSLRYDALVAALESGHLGGANLDVFDIEPLPADRPLLRCRQVVLTPHQADQTPKGSNCSMWVS